MCTLWKARYVTKLTSPISLESYYTVLWNIYFYFFLPYCTNKRVKWVVSPGWLFQHILKLQLVPFFSSKTEGLFFMHPAHFGFHPNKPTRYGEEISENLRNWRALGWAGKTSNEWAGAIHCNREKIKCQSQSLLCSAFPVFLSTCTLPRTAIF